MKVVVYQFDEKTEVNVWRDGSKLTIHEFTTRGHVRQAILKLAELSEETREIQIKWEKR
jgi:hypothetical protein